MCGRYVLAEFPDLPMRFRLRPEPIALGATFNAAPAARLPVVVTDPAGERVLRPMRWGLTPRWRTTGQGGAPAPINARAETLLERPMFRPLVRGRRCLVPANGFYEWQRTGGRKQPYYLTVEDQPLFAFAGLYDEAPGGDTEASGSYAIITTRANALLAPIHDRMPVILRREDEAEWLDPAVRDDGIVERLLGPYPAEAMAATPVSTVVNNARNDGPELVEPIARPR